MHEFFIEKNEEENRESVLQVYHRHRILALQAENKEQSGEQLDGDWLRVEKTRHTGRRTLRCLAHRSKEAKDLIERV